MTRVRRRRRAGEIRGGDLERLGAEAGYASGEILVDLDGAELAAVIKLKHAAIEGEDGVGVLAGRAARIRTGGRSCQGAAAGNRRRRGRPE